LRTACFKSSAGSRRRLDPEEVARHDDGSALAALILAIATINVWNRISVTARQVVGARW